MISPIRGVFEKTNVKMSYECQDFNLWAPKWLIDKYIEAVNNIHVSLENLAAIESKLDIQIPITLVLIFFVLVLPVLINMFRIAWHLFKYLLNYYVTKKLKYALVFPPMTKVANQTPQYKGFWSHFFNAIQFWNIVKGLGPKVAVTIAIGRTLSLFFNYGLLTDKVGRDLEKAARELLYQKKVGVLSAYNSGCLDYSFSLLKAKCTFFNNLYFTATSMPVVEIGVSVGIALFAGFVGIKVIPYFVELSFIYAAGLEKMSENFAEMLNRQTTPTPPPNTAQPEPSTAPQQQAYDYAGHDLHYSFRGSTPSSPPSTTSTPDSLATNPEDKLGGQAAVLEALAAHVTLHEMLNSNTQDNFSGFSTDSTTF